MCVCVCLEQSRNWRKANPSWSGKFADSILSRLVLVTTVLSLRWLPSLCDQQCQPERASGGSWWEESALSTAWNSIPLLPRFLFLSSGNLLDHHFGLLRSRPGYLGQRGAAPGVAFGFLFPEQSLRWKCCTSLGQIFFFPHSVLEITLYHEALFSHSSVLPLHLQDEVEDSSGNDGRKGRGFFWPAKVSWKRDMCADTHINAENPARLSWGKSHCSC